MSTDTNVDEIAARQAARLAKRERAGLPNDDRHLIVHSNGEMSGDVAPQVEEQPAVEAVPAAVEAPPSPAEPRVISEMTVKIFDTGHANINGPINDPLAIGKLIEAAFVCYVHHYSRLQAQLAVEQALAQLRSQAPRGSFVHRILDRVRAGRKSA